MISRLPLVWVPPDLKPFDAVAWNRPKSAGLKLTVTRGEKSMLEVYDLAQQRFPGIGDFPELQPEASLTAA